jgi:hypothetical protein
MGLVGKPEFGRYGFVRQALHDALARQAQSQLTRPLTWGCVKALDEEPLQLPY